MTLPELRYALTVRERAVVPSMASSRLQTCDHRNLRMDLRKIVMVLWRAFRLAHKHTRRLNNRGVTIYGHPERSATAQVVLHCCGYRLLPDPSAYQGALQRNPVISRLRRIRGP